MFEPNRSTNLGTDRTLALTRHARLPVARQVAAVAPVDKEPIPMTLTVTRADLDTPPAVVRVPLHSRAFVTGSALARGRR